MKKNNFFKQKLNEKEFYFFNQKKKAKSKLLII
jgi:hypothetical protein